MPIIGCFLCVHVWRCVDMHMWVCHEGVVARLDERFQTGWHDANSMPLSSCWGTCCCPEHMLPLNPRLIVGSRACSSA